MERTPQWIANDRLRKHKLLTQKDLKALPPLYSQEDVADPLVPVKFFHALSGWRWYLLELDPETGIAFAFVDGAEAELGYVDVTELAEMLVRIPVERDCYWTPVRLSEVKALARR
jgi:hypothetical protein